MICEVCERHAEACICELREKARNSRPDKHVIFPLPTEYVDGVRVTLRPNGATGLTEVRFTLPTGVPVVIHDARDHADGLARATARIRQVWNPTLKPKPVQPVQAQKPLVTLYTDGSNRGNPGPGGWGALLVAADGREQELSGPIVSATNNIAELTAVIMGLRALKRPCRVRLVSDSEYVVKGISQWLDGWIAKGWVGRTGEPVKNQALWEEIDALRQTHEITAEWVRGHDGHPENERVDALAGAASKAEKARQDAAAGIVPVEKPKAKRKRKARGEREESEIA